MAKPERRETSDAKKGPIQDLREWLQRVEEMGDLVRVKDAVSCEEEMSAIGYLVAKQNPSPAILFERSKDMRRAPSRLDCYGTSSAPVSRGLR